MSPVVTRYEHIAVGEDQVPVIAGTTIKVGELVAEKLAYGWSPEELHFQHPYLTLGQVYSALAYYADHAQEIDADLERRLRFVDRMRQTAARPPLLKRLRGESS